MKDPNYFLRGLVDNNELIVREIYKNSFGQVLNFILSNKGQRTDADDVFQKALMQILVRAKTRSFSINSSFEAFLFVTCKNLWRRELNKKKKEVTKPKANELISEERELALSLLEQERWEFFQEKLQLISDNCRKILEFFFNKVSYKVIAQKLGYGSENVVRQRVFKCKTKLIKSIKEDKRYQQLKEL